MIFGRIQLYKVVESANDGDVCDSVCTDIQKSDLFVVEHHRKKSLDFFFRDSQPSVSHGFAIGGLAETSQCSFESLL